MESEQLESANESAKLNETVVSTTTPTKRIVVEHTRGICKGLFGIYGTEAELRAKFDGKLPEIIPNVDMRDHTGAICLVGVKSRFVHYREITPPRANVLGQDHVDPRQQ